MKFEIRRKGSDLDTGLGHITRGKDLSIRNDWDILDEEDIQTPENQWYIVGYEDGSKDRGLNIDFADNSNYFSGYEDGRGDHEAAISESSKSGIMETSEEVREVHDRINNIFEERENRE